jgi:hypothetical protein
MAKYRKKFMVENPVQWFPELPCAEFIDSMRMKYRVWDCGVRELTEGQLYDMGCRFVQPVATKVIIHTPEGDHEVSPGDYIITGPQGEKYPIKPDIFADTYELVPEEPIAPRYPNHPTESDLQPSEEVRISAVVYAFSRKMEGKMIRKYREGKRGWDNVNNEEFKDSLCQDLARNLAQGDYADVANIAMILDFNK